MEASKTAEKPSKFDDIASRLLELMADAEADGVLGHVELKVHYMHGEAQRYEMTIRRVTKVA